jgi:N6-adenosine-specific RNA methylase IME4
VEAPAVDPWLAELVRYEDEVVHSDADGLRARWWFGETLVKRRGDAGRLANGELARVVDEVGVSRAEITHRMRFYERFPTADQLSNAVRQFGSWHAIVRDALPMRSDDDVPLDPGPLPEGVYRTIVADPPWRYDNRATRGAAEDHYATMSLAELAGLDVEERAAEQAHLYLWTTNGFLREAFDLVDAWGFEYRTCLTWVKPQIGLGNYFRSSTEHVLFGVRGRLRTLVRDERNWLEAPRGRHSAKPEAFYDLVQRASPGPYLEMFARQRRLGWDVWGREA